MKLVLASSSPARKQLLNQLGLPFDTFSPDIDESALPNENTEQYVARLALEKARTGLDGSQDDLIIGSDQACTLNGLILGKPGTRDAAIKHLKLCSGNWLQFHTGLAVINSETAKEQVVVETYRVLFRQLSAEEIEYYINLDNPLACAGCFKAEAAGIMLFERMEGDDFNTLLGLPLIRLVSLLRNEGFNPLLPAKS